MAKRRRFAQALGAGLEGAGDTLAQIMLLLERQKQAERQIQLQGEKEKEVASYRAGLDRDLLTTRFKAEQDAKDAERGPSAIDKLYTDIQEAKNPADVPSAQAITGRMASVGQRDPFFDFQQGVPTVDIPGLGKREVPGIPMRSADQRTPIEELIRAEQAKRAAVDDQVKQAALEYDRKQNRIGPEGAAGFIGKGGEFIPTERTGAQQGQREKETLMGGQLSPEVLETQAQQARDLEMAKLDPDIVAAEARRAGLITAAQESAKQRALGGEGALTPSMRAGIQRLGTTMAMLESLDPYLTQERGPKGLMKGTVQSLLSRFGADTPAHLYNDLSDSLLPALARSSGEVGNLAEKEQVRYAKLAPKVGDPLNIRRAKYAAIQFIVDAANHGKKAEELSPFLDYLQFVEGGEKIPGKSISADDFLKLGKGGR